MDTAIKEDREVGRCCLVKARNRWLEGARPDSSLTLDRVRPMYIRSFGLRLT